jgi:hypothetical protein
MSEVLFVSNLGLAIYFSFPCLWTPSHARSGVSLCAGVFRSSVLYSVGSIRAVLLTRSSVLVLAIWISARAAHQCDLLLFLPSIFTTTAFFFHCSVLSPVLGDGLVLGSSRVGGVLLGARYWPRGCVRRSHFPSLLSCRLEFSFCYWAFSLHDGAAPATKFGSFH